jgi:hypothetical protein
MRIGWGIGIEEEVEGMVVLGFVVYEYRRWRSARLRSYRAANE